jgi:hypothetical protein
LAGSKNARKKIAAVKKRPDVPRRSTEISQTPPKAFGVKHEKFRSFRFGERPGGRFFEADPSFFRAFKTGTGMHVRRLIL